MGEALPDYLWAAIPFVVSAGSAILTAVLMHARTEAALARERAMLAEARALLATQHRAFEERLRATGEEVRRKALEEFLGDVRVEERRYATGARLTILEERVCFRDIPLTPWFEREVPGTPALPVASVAENSGTASITRIAPRIRALLR